MGIRRPGGIREHVVSVNVANGVPYERGPMRTLTCRHEPSSILEASEQAFGTCPTTMPHVRTLTVTALGSLAPSYSISTGSIIPSLAPIHVCRHDAHEQHSLGSTSRAPLLDIPSSPAFCAVTCRLPNYSTRLKTLKM